MSSPKHISLTTLRSWMDSKPESLAIVDVRDGDYFGGHIRNSINVPSSSFYGNLSYLEQALSDKKKVVFHCMLSQQRGPSCAAAYSKMVNHSQEIYVLTGGFNEWAKKFGNDPKYTEGYISELYE